MDGDPKQINISSSSSSSSMEINEGMNARTDGDHQPTEDRLIEMGFCGSTPLLWRMDDLKRSRDIGVIGNLVGSLARQPRQNVRLGRPLQLLQEEALLLEQSTHATAALHTEKCEDKEMHLKYVKNYQAGLERSYKEQSSLALEDKKAVLQRVMNEKENDTKDSSQAVRERLNALDQAFHFPLSAMAVQLCTARAGFSHCPEEHSFLSTDWPVPRDERLKTRLCVYRDLRNKGFYLTSAGKFGGDYLVYPGDPLRFHAHFIALCISIDEELPLCDILAIARLGSNVKKTVLLCSPRNPTESAEDEGMEGDVVYSSLQWSSMA